MFRLIKKKKLKIIYLTSNSGLCCLFRLLLAHPTHTASPQVGQSVPPTQQPAGGRSLPTQGQAAQCPTTFVTTLEALAVHFTR